MHHYLNDNELVAAAVKGDEQAMSLIIKSLMPCVEVEASKFTDVVGMTRNDLIQEGLLGGVRAVFGFNPERDAEFKTYAKVCIKNSISTAMRNQRRDKHKPLNSFVPLDEVEITGDNPHDPETVVFMAEEMEQIRSCIKNELTQLEYGVLMCYVSGDSYSEIADKFGINTKSVENALSRSRKKLKAARNV